MKAGTSSFHRYLSRHPQIFGGREKEVHFFDYRWHMGVDWYRASFPKQHSLPAGAMVGETSPYYLFHPAVPGRVAKTLPDARLIVLLRDPVERAFSQYRRAVNKGQESLSFDAALDAEEERLAGEADRLMTTPRSTSARHQAYSYLSRGRYAEQLERWFEWFDRESLLAIKSEDLFSDPASVARVTQRFLGLSERDLGELPHLNAAPKMSWNPATRERLREYFEPHNENLRRLLDWDSTW